MLLQSLHCELQAAQAILDQSVPCMVQSCSREQAAKLGSVLLTVLANRHTVMTALYVKVLGSAFALTILKELYNLVTVGH